MDTTIFTRFCDNLVEDYESTLYEMVEVSGDKTLAVDNIIDDIEKELRKVVLNVRATLLATLE